MNEILYKILPDEICQTSCSLLGNGVSFCRILQALNLFPALQIWAMAKKNFSKYNLSFDGDNIGGDDIREEKRD